MTREEVIDKVSKLFALGESDNEHEAQSAIAMAQKLMAKYHLEISDVKCNSTDSKLVHEWTNNSVAGSWVATLAITIANEMRCKVLASAGRTMDIKFVGFEEDVAMCKHVFNFAVDFVHKNGISKSIEYRKEHGTAKGFRESYAYGFINGLQEQYDANKKSNKEDWGLVLVTPKEVEDKVNELSRGKRTLRQNVSRTDAYESGKEDGKKYTHAERIS